jgi:hypothetical protein
MCTGNEEPKSCLTRFMVSDKQRTRNHVHDAGWVGVVGAQQGVVVVGVESLIGVLMGFDGQVDA